MSDQIYPDHISAALAHANTLFQVMLEAGRGVGRWLHRPSVITTIVMGHSGASMELEVDIQDNTENRLEYYVSLGYQHQHDYLDISITSQMKCIIGCSKDNER